MVYFAAESCNSLARFSPRESAHSIGIYYMDKCILLATKTLVEFICHYIRDPSGVFSVCHAREWYIDKFPPFLLFFFQNGRRVQGLWS